MATARPKNPLQAGPIPVIDRAASTRAQTKITQSSLNPVPTQGSSSSGGRKALRSTYRVEHLAFLDHAYCTKGSRQHSYRDDGTGSASAPFSAFIAFAYGGAGKKRAAETVRRSKKEARASRLTYNPRKGGCRFYGPALGGQEPEDTALTVPLHPSASTALAERGADSQGPPSEPVIRFASRVHRRISECPGNLEIRLPFRLMSQAFRPPGPVSVRQDTTEAVTMATTILGDRDEGLTGSMVRIDQEVEEMVEEEAEAALEEMAAESDYADGPSAVARIIRTQPPAWDKEINEIICADIETLQNTAEHYSSSLLASWMLTEQITQVLNAKSSVPQQSTSTHRFRPRARQANVAEIEAHGESEEEESAVLWESFPKLEVSLPRYAALADTLESFFGCFAPEVLQSKKVIRDRVNRLNGRLPSTKKAIKRCTGGLGSEEVQGTLHSSSRILKGDGGGWN
ncbi:hypothetical protein B0H19DRAFT_1084898 [Mycena capillaripes]|nr:hypothetical protein B0H19DRAFT_1084898 [Mycena capillaripes]